jgi:metal-dependent amidase/aminoacylase/carboxypeptidase family protein
VAPHHHPEFDIDERCLPIGCATLVRAALTELNAG